MDIKKIYLASLLILTLSGVHMSADSNTDTVISGELAKKLSVACNLFEKKLNVKWENYDVTISESDTHTIFNFHSKNLSHGLRGSPEGVPGFEVKIPKQDSDDIESQFIR